MLRGMESRPVTENLAENMAVLARILPPPAPDAAGRYRDQSPPPLPDSGGDRFDWEDLAARTGWRYPADYRRFLETYGAGGTISRSLTISSVPPAGVEYRVDRGAVFPPQDGLRAWGEDDVADEFFWRCADPDPDMWTVAVHTRNARDGQRWFDYPMGMVEFLVGLLSGTLDVPLGVDLHGSPDTVRAFAGWREQDLEVLDHYPEFKGSWAPDDPSESWYEA